MIASSAHTTGYTTPAAILSAVQGMWVRKTQIRRQGHRLQRFPVMCDQQRLWVKTSGE
jgi:hypothetical protein